MKRKIAVTTGGRAEYGILRPVLNEIQLSDKFQALIDEAAMRRKFAGTDAYLEEWNKGPKTEQDGSADAVVQAIADEIESRFAEIRDVALAKSS